MADLPPDPASIRNTGADIRTRPGRGAPPGVPRWVKVSAAIAIAVVVLFVIVHLAGGGFRGHAPLVPYSVLLQ